ncbi:MAG: MarR family transcriptional regulator, partial [Pseudomonadota bacterium]
MNSTVGDDHTARSQRKKGSFDVYAEGGTSAEILLTLQLVLVTRRWRSLLDDKLRPIRQSSARMEAMSAIFNSRELPAQVDIARRLRIEGPTLTRMLARLETEGLVER